MALLLPLGLMRTYRALFGSKCLRRSWIQRLNARWNALGSEKPSKYEISPIEIVSFFRCFIAMAFLTSSSNFRYSVPFTFSFNYNLRTLIACFFAISLIFGSDPGIILMSNCVVLWVNVSSESSGTRNLLSGYFYVGWNERNNQKFVCIIFEYKELHVEYRALHVQTQPWPMA